MLFNYLYFEPKNKDLPFAIKDDKIIKADVISKDPMFQTIQETFFKNYTKNPFFYFSGTHDISQLDFFMSLQKCNKIVKNDNVDFFFFEPLTHYLSTAILPYRPHILRSNNSVYDRKHIRSYELDSISKWVKKYKIKNLTVYCTDYGSEKYYKSVYTNLNLKFIDVFSISVFEEYNLFQKAYKRESVNYEVPITKKLIAPAWRYDPSRHFILSFLAEKNLLENNNVSFLHKVSNEEMMEVMWFNWKEFEFKYEGFSSLLLSGNEKLSKLVPLTLNVENPKVIHGANGKSKSGSNQVVDHNISEKYKESFLSIVMESRVTQPWPNISEKTINAIINNRPFVIAGAPGVLAMLKDMGFKTFHEFWDESYDMIEAHDDRMIAVCNLIDSICKKSIEEMRDMHKGMSHILKHNKKQILKVREFYEKCL